MTLDSEATDLLCDKLVTITDEETATKLARRGVRACRSYLKSIDAPEDNINIFSTRLYGLSTKLNQDTVKQILDDKLRFKDLINADIYSVTEDLKNTRIHLTNKLAPVDANSCSIYRCPRCKERKHTYKEIQRRCLDEPANVVCTCLVCSFKFSF